jgi:hypothetical protein
LLTKGLGRILHGAAVAAGVAALGHVARPDVLPQVMPPEYAVPLVLAAQLFQALIGQRAFEVNRDGSPAELPAPPRERQGG